MLELKDINLSYGDKKILEDVNVSFAEGTVSVISGASGSGKSSLIKLLNGVIPQFVNADIKGDIIVDDDDISQKDVAARSDFISTVFQNPKSQFYSINTTDEIVFALENRNLPKDEIVDTVREYTEILGTKKLLDRDIFKLSGGEKQLVAITAVACMKQKVYIFDEPSASLDIDAIKRLKSAIKTLKELGKIIIIVEHRLYYLKDILDKLYAIEDAKLIELESVDEESIKRHNLRTLNEISKQELIEGCKDFSYRKVSVNNNSTSDLGKEDRILSCRNYKYSYMKNRVFDFSIDFSRGIHFIIGENGIGKSTFVRCLCGLNKGFGKGFYYKNNFIKKPEKLISLVMQDVNYQLFTESVLEEISLVTDDEKLKEDVLVQLLLWDKRQQHPQSLSGGEKQRLSISLCMASKKPLVIFDEPTSGLCKDNMKKTIEFIKDMEKEGKTIIIISHDYEFIKSCGGNIIEFV